MSYTLAAPMRSRAACEKMLAFLERHFDTKFGEPTARLAYDTSQYSIGFNGTATTMAIGVCAWMSLKAGRRIYFPTRQCPKVSGPCKYLRYDGRDTWPLLVRQRFDTAVVGRGYTQVNWVGAPLVAPGAHRRAFAETRTIHAELLRLENAWQKEKRDGHLD